jgi:hypothetical protein
VAVVQGGRERPRARARPVHQPERGRAVRVHPARELRRLEVPQEEAAAPRDGPEEPNPVAGFSSSGSTRPVAGHQIVFVLLNCALTFSLG